MKQIPLADHILLTCPNKGDKTALAKELGISLNELLGYVRRGGWVVITHKRKLTIEGEKAVNTLKKYGVLK